MNSILCLLIAITCATGAPMTKIIPWKDACDGAEIEVISDGAVLRSVRTSATHSQIIAAWTVHFVDGVAVSAEYRETIRGRILEGERAGEYSGADCLAKVETWKSEKEGFSITDPARDKELAEILAVAREQAGDRAR